VKKLKPYGRRIRKSLLESMRKLLQENAFKTIPTPFFTAFSPVV